TSPTTLTGTAGGAPSILLGLLATSSQIPPLGGVESALTAEKGTLFTDASTLEGFLPALIPGGPGAPGALTTIVTGRCTASAPVGFPGAASGGVLTQLLIGIDHPAGTFGASDTGGLVQGLQTIAGGLSHPVGALGASDPGGIDEGLAALL